jgi:Carboxypeptidase regulatory-like domain
MGSQQIEGAERAKFARVAILSIATFGFNLIGMKSLQIGFIGLILFTANAWAASPVLQGVVTDPKGYPIKGADIRIETTNGGKLLKTIKTDANGRYISDRLPAGAYRVTLVLNGAVKASINNAKIELGGPTQLNFKLASTSASQAFAPAEKGKHWIWVPADSGSRLPGHWIEVDDSGSWATAAGPLNVLRVSGEELERQIHSADIIRGQ